MMMRIPTLLALGGALVVGACDPTSLAQSDDSLGTQQRLPEGFTAEVLELDDVTIGYVIGGSGPPLILLHGWPQTWYEWHEVMPELAQSHTVIVPDLRGIGLSAPASEGFDKATMAAGLHALVEDLGLESPVVVGHDIGGMTAYAYAITYPGEASKVVIADVPLPGLDHFALIAADPRAWHFGFHQAEQMLAERLLEGQVEEYYRWFIDHMAFEDAAISDEDVAVFTESYLVEGGLTAGMEWYRAFDADAEYNAAHAVALETPMLIMGGEYSLGPLLGLVEQELEARHGAPVDTFFVEGSGHWLPEEQPDAFLAGLNAFLGG